MACSVFFFQQADVDETKIKQFQKLKELPPMQLRQVCSIVNCDSSRQQIFLK